MSQDARYRCPMAGCGGTLGDTGKKKRMYGGHHVRLFECGACGQEVGR